jgi:DNA-binding transcriptional MerR regulator
MHGLSVGNEVLKQLHQEMSLDKVEKLMDQTREGVEYQRVSCPMIPHKTDADLQEIDETLQSRMSPEEEEAVQAELEALQREAMVSYIEHPFERKLMDSQMSLSLQKRNVWLCRMCQSKSLRRQRLQHQRDKKMATSLGNVWLWRLDDT